MKKLAQLLITFYQKCISPLFPSCCRFYPTCSAYTKEAVRRFGFVRGIWLGGKRILRCQPFCKGGVDPVPETFSWFRRKKKKTADDPPL